MLESQELEDLRTEAELALPDTCTIQTATETNTKGSVAVTFANTYTGVACRLAWANRAVAERQIGEKLAAISEMVLTVPFDQTVSPSNRVIHGGVTYEVVAVANDMGSWRTVRRVYLKRLQ